MSNKTVATRRSFIAVAGASLSAPVAAAAAALPWLPPSGGSSTALEARLATLEDVNAIRALNRAYFCEGPVIVDGHAVSPAGFGVDDAIDVAADRATASARVQVTVRIETPIGPECTVVEMATLQGGGVITHEQSGVLVRMYVRRGGVWTVSHASLVRVDA
jgi:hypothetical protein